MTKPLALKLPLQGRQWIEASAGTGKTFTLSLLVLRLLLEREIPLPNILAVTFTKAATQELKIKIRERIKQSLDLLNKAALDDLESIEAGQQSTALYLTDMLRKKPQNQMRHLLDVALQDCDRASIFTIHGFCSRVLADHALSAGQVLQAPTLLTNTTVLNTKIAYDIWRELSVDHDSMRALLRLWPTPESLAKQCDSLLQSEYLLPETPAELPAEFDMAPSTRYLRDAVELHLEAARDTLLHASDQGVLSLSYFKPGQIQQRFDNLAGWHALDNGETFDDPDFSWLSAGFIASRLKKPASKKSAAPEPPASPLFDAIERWYQGFEQQQAREIALDIRCLHFVRERLRARREALLQKRQQYAYDDLITQVVRGLEGESSAELIELLRKEYPVALVDEFQDTDSQQWKIFSTLYPEYAPENFPELALYLIGDPKQAIYGFRGGDVHAYLAAKRETASHWNLPENFRSRPGLLGAVETLFDEGGANAFREQDIRFYPVRAGGIVQEQDFLLQGKPAPAMQLALLPEYLDWQKQKAAPLPTAKAHELATRACVEKIHELLSAGRQNDAQLKNKKTGEYRGVSPGDVAVLVNKNSEAIQVQSALASCGIASVISSQENLFATLEAQEVFVILDALVKHQDQSRWRGALSTLLLGFDAEKIRQLELDDVAATSSADLAVHYRELWLKQGVLSLLSQLCATAAARIQPMADGERRLSNYLQLAEALQEASALTLGPEQCLRWLARAMQEAAVDEENMLRLDSDRKRVKILTLHKSKGLEFPLVFLPFANFGKSSRSGSGLGLLNYHEQHRRITHAMLYRDTDKDRVKTIKAMAAEEQLAEQVRLLYVGLTRAQYYCWVCCGAVNQGNNSGLSSLLFRNEKDEIKLSSQADILHRLDTIRKNNPDILIDEIPYQKQELPRFKTDTGLDAIPVATPVDHLQLDWRVLSFSQLSQHGQHQSPTVSAAADEIEASSFLLSATEEVFDKRFAGIAFGNALHQALENTDMQIWREHGDAASPPASELPVLQQALLRQGYTQEEWIPGVQHLSPLIFNTLKIELPEGTRLVDLPLHARLNEMEFHFSLRECDSQALLSLLKRHDILRQREDFAWIRNLNGLMTGKIDLTYRHDGRFYICDYKSNRLPAYDSERCRQAMRESEYDFQALIYTLALHRWCKFRLRSGYDYEKHIGGIRYLFCRGLNAVANSGDGIVAMRFDRTLIEQLENLLHPLPELAT